MNDLLLEIYASDFTLNESRPRKLCQGSQVDMNLIAVIDATDVAGQGAGIGGFYISADQREGKPRNRIHAKLL